MGYKSIVLIDCGYVYFYTLILFLPFIFFNSCVSSHLDCAYMIEGVGKFQDFFLYPAETPSYTEKREIGHIC